MIYRIDPKAIIVADVFDKTTTKTPKHVIENCQRRFKSYDDAVKVAAQAAKKKVKGQTPPGEG